MSNVTVTNYFTIFLQTIDMANFLWFSSKPTINSTFSFTNNYLPHQQFEKFFVNKICISNTTLLIYII